MVRAILWRYPVVLPGIRFWKPHHPLPVGWPYLRPRQRLSSSSPSRTRTYNKPVNSRKDAGHKIKQDKTYGEEQLTLSAPLALEPADPDLARLCTAWATLPPHLKAAILALVQA